MPASASTSSATKACRGDARRLPAAALRAAGRPYRRNEVVAFTQRGADGMSGGQAVLAIWVDIDPADDSLLRTLAQPRACCRSASAVPAGCAAAASRASTQPGRYLLFYDAETTAAFESDDYYARLRQSDRDEPRHLPEVPQHLAHRLHGRAALGRGHRCRRADAAHDRRQHRALRHAGRRWRRRASTCWRARPTSARPTRRRRTCAPRPIGRSNGRWSPSSGRWRPPRRRVTGTRPRARSSLSDTPCRRAISSS